MSKNPLQEVAARFSSPGNYLSNQPVESILELLGLEVNRAKRYFLEAYVTTDFSLVRKLIAHPGFAREILKKSMAELYDMMGLINIHVTARRYVNEGKGNTPYKQVVDDAWKGLGPDAVNKEEFTKLLAQELTATTVLDVVG